MDENMALFFAREIHAMVWFSINVHFKCKEVLQVCSHAILGVFSQPASQPAIAYLSMYPSLYLNLLCNSNLVHVRSGGQREIYWV